MLPLFNKGRDFFPLKNREFASLPNRIEVVKKLNPVCDEIKVEISKRFESTGYNILSVMKEIENQFKNDDFSGSVISNYMSKQSTDLIFIENEEKYIKDFIKINTAWIEKYFHMEESDYRLFKDPKKYIINNDGYIFFVKDKDEIVGTCALVKRSNDLYEFSKMECPRACNQKVLEGS